MIIRTLKVVNCFQFCNLEAAKTVYMSSNPSLRNPINWTAVGAVSGLLALVVSLVALFVACGNIN